MTADPSSDPGTLLQQADIAMYEAKSAGRDGFLDRRLVGQPEAGEIDQRAGAEVVDQRHFAFACQRGELARSDLLGKALDPIVGGVNF